MAGKSVRIENAPWGMGDAMWLLPILRALHETYDRVYLPTPWPALFWALPWIKPLRPDANTPYADWPLFGEALRGVPEKTWAVEPEDAETVSVCRTGDYSTRLRSFYSFEGPADMRFELKSAWLRDASYWLQYIFGRPQAKRPRVLLHIPTQVPGEKPQGRYCQPSLFQDLHDRFRERVMFFDCQRIATGDSELVAELPVPVRHSTAAEPRVLWALAREADAIVTTDNHGLPLAISQERPTLYLAGDVPLDYLLDPRIDRSRIEVVPNGCEGAGPAFERLLENL